ncbi:hypothetical protein MRB53_011425 [Persea americana]|uniref:Uncharacterized protein n=1 Tax=Persea americana TaxID=3435 RepID=A0ACC2LVE3_PERAE|nr:hypothetical protein MRB53_011425 [Persea americana]
MSKTFFFLILVLLLSKASTATARSLPKTDPQAPVYTTTDTPSSLDSSINGDECDGRETEECRMRMLMAAHTDYIYTQDTKDP